MKREIIPKGEMTEKNLFKTAKIFWPKGEWETQVRYYYDPSNRRKFYLVDCCSKLKKIVFEYEGPQHYENVWKLKRDEEREAYFNGIGYKFFRWPYYCQLTRDVAKYYFTNDYSEEKYLKAIEEVYGVKEERHILSPGLHQSKNTPANFVARGVRRYFDELDSFPPSVKAQVAECLRRYVKEIDDDYLVIGEGEEFKTLLETPISEKDLDIYFHRKVTQ